MGDKAITSETELTPQKINPCKHFPLNQPSQRRSDLRCKITPKSAVPSSSTIGDSVDRERTVRVQPTNTWWKKVGTFYLRNPKAFSPEDGAVWTRGKVGEIYEDQTYYVPQDFGWFSKNGEDIKSLIHGIGWQVKNTKGAGINGKTKEINFQALRDENEEKNDKIESGSMTRYAELDWRPYYRLEDGRIGVFDKNLCVYATKGENEEFGKGYIFVGFKEVEVDNDIGSSRKEWERWKFKNNEMLSKINLCERLQFKGLKEFRLSYSSNDRTLEGSGGDKKEYLLLSNAKDGETAYVIRDSENDDRQYVAVLAGVAVNLNWNRAFDNLFSESSPCKQKDRNKDENGENCKGELEKARRKIEELKKILASKDRDGAIKGLFKTKGGLKIKADNLELNKNVWKTWRSELGYKHQE